MAGFGQAVLDRTAREREVDLTTWGRRTGRPTRVTLWIWGDDQHLYVRAGGGMSRDWPRNLLAHGRGILHLGDQEIPVRARQVTDPAEARRGAELINRKYNAGATPSAEGGPLNRAEQATFELLPDTESHGWSEANSAQFLGFARVVTPARDEQLRLLADLVPAQPDEPCRIAELGCGGGDLAAALLERFPRASYLGLDGSPTMLRAAAERLAPFAERVSLRPFRLEEIETWRRELGSPVRCVVSSLVVHHLADAQKRLLYQALSECLEPNGALLLIDLVLPTSSRARAALGTQWDAIVQEQSQALTGSLAAYNRFREIRWNFYAHPDPIDQPASLFQQLRWLEATGFRDVDCFWQRAGHALFGGYR